MNDARAEIRNRAEDKNGLFLRQRSLLAACLVAGRGVALAPLLDIEALRNPEVRAEFRNGRFLPLPVMMLPAAGRFVLRVSEVWYFEIPK
jgi:hypothetical protein